MSDTPYAVQVRTPIAAKVLKTWDPEDDPEPASSTTGTGMGWLFGIGFLIIGVGLVSGRR